MYLSHKNVFINFLVILFVSARFVIFRKFSFNILRILEIDHLYNMFGIPDGT